MNASAKPIHPRLSDDERLHLLSRCAVQLASSEDFAKTIVETIGACLPAIGDFGFFDVVDGEIVRRSVGAYEDPQTESLLAPTQWMRQERTDMNLCALSTGEAAYHPDTDDAWYMKIAANEQHLALLRQLAFGSMISVPMRFRGELLGAFTLFMGKSGRRHVEPDIDVASELAAIAAPIVFNARLLKDKLAAEDALRKSEERLRLAVKAGKLATWEWDIVEDRVTWSDEVYEHHGLVPGSFGGRAADFAALIHPNDQPEVMERLERALQGQAPYSAEYRPVRPDGAPRWLATRGDIYRDGSGRPVRMVGAAFDVTERHDLLDAQRAALAEAEAARREAEAARGEAESANRAKDQFLAMLGHELRNPLAPIAASLHLMKARGDGQLSKERGIIERQVAHLNRLVDDLLDVSRVMQGKFHLEFERVDLAEVVELAIEQCKPLLERRLIELSVGLPPEPLPVLADRTRLCQVICNVLSNAVKFTPEHGKIRISADRNDEWIEIKVADNGIGIPPELLPKVFDLFTQGPQELDRKQGGLGLGLPLAMSLMRMHGGSLAAHSDGEGEGSTFSIRTPLAGVDAGLPIPGNVQDSSVTPLEVLVVDDNVDAAESLQLLLETAGCTSRVAVCAEDALAMLQEFMPQVALLDIGLPRIDGYQLAQRMKADRRTRDIRLIAVTGYGTDADRKRALAAGFDDHLVKPVGPSVLFEALNKIDPPARPAAMPQA